MTQKLLLKINVLALNIQTLEEDFEDGSVDIEYVEEFIDENIELIEFMSKTIDDFRNFFKVNRDKETFDIRESVVQIVSIFKVQLENHNIALKYNSKSFLVNGFKSEFQQVLLNIINNAKDAIISKQERAKYDGKIDITVNESGTLKILDNGGGVPTDIIDRVFEPYFTTKEDNKGTGVGLYMSKMIIDDNMGGKLSVRNEKDGAMFVIELTPTLRD